VHPREAKRRARLVSSAGAGRRVDTRSRRGRGAPNSSSFAMSSTLLERASRAPRRWAPASGALTHVCVSCLPYFAGVAKPDCDAIIAPHADEHTHLCRCALTLAASGDQRAKSARADHSRVRGSLDQDYPLSRASRDHPALYIVLVLPQQRVSPVAACALPRSILCSMTMSF
jgi:hypothetical protein